MADDKVKNYSGLQANELLSRSISQYIEQVNAKALSDYEHRILYKGKLFKKLYNHYFDSDCKVSESELQQALEVIRQDLEDPNNVVLTRHDGVFDVIRLSEELNLPTSIYRVRLILKNRKGNYQAVLAFKEESPTFYNYRIKYNVSNPHPYEVWCSEKGRFGSGRFPNISFGEADSYEEAKKLTAVLYERYKDAKERERVESSAEPETWRGASIPLVWPIYMHYEYTMDGKVYRAHVDCEYADDMHYDLEAEEWRKFCQICLGPGDEVKNFNSFLVRCNASNERMAFENAMEKAGIRFNVFAYYSYDWDD